MTELATRQRLPLDAALATGDGANDLDMLLAAGLGVAFRAKPIVAAAARAQVDHTHLQAALLFAQGYPASARSPRSNDYAITGVPGEDARRDQLPCLLSLPLLVSGSGT